MGFQLQWSGDVLVDGPKRFVLVQTFAAAEKIIGIDNAEGEIAIGYGDLLAAGVVTNRSGARARAARSDEQPAGFSFDLRDGAAARADRFDIDDRLLHAKSFDDRFLRVTPVALGDQADVEARSAHVGGDDVFVFQPASDE